MNPTLQPDSPTILLTHYDNGGIVGSAKPIALTKPRTVIGRNSGECDVVVDCNRVSRIHCTIVQSGDTATMLDGDGKTPSAWGIRVKGESYNSIALVDGMVVTIFDEYPTTFTIEYRSKGSRHTGLDDTTSSGGDAAINNLVVRLESGFSRMLEIAESSRSDVSTVQVDQANEIERRKRADEVRDRKFKIMFMGLTFIGISSVIAVLASLVGVIYFVTNDRAFTFQVAQAIGGGVVTIGTVAIGAYFKAKS